MTTAAGIILTHDDRALFLKRSPKARDHQGEWCCPGGSIEGGETPEAAARRELTEETGLTAGDLTRIDEGSGFLTFRQNVGEEAEPTLNDEHVEFRWAPISDPPQPLHPGVAATLKKLLVGNAQDRREWDTNGWFEVLDNPLSTVGVYPYSEASVIKGGDPNKMVGVYRPAEELSDPETVKSFRLMPWTDDHPEALLGDASQALVPSEQKGVHGVIGEKTYFRDGTLFGNLKIFSEALARKIAAGKRELSCGYRCDFVPSEGVYQGTPYQYVQKNLRGNHVASVRAGRMGAGVRVLDAAEPSLTLSFALDLKEAMDWKAFPSYTLADLERAVAEGRGTPAIVQEIADRKSGVSTQRVTPQIVPPRSNMTPFAIKSAKDDEYDILDASLTAGQAARFCGKSACGTVEGEMPVRVINAHSNASKVTKTESIGKRTRMYEGGSVHLPTATVERAAYGNRPAKQFEAHWHSLSAATDVEPCADCGRAHAAEEDCMDADTLKFIKDSFGSLVGELERKGYSKNYATKIAGKVAAEKGKTGHQSTDEVTTVADKTEAEIKAEKEAQDRKAARDAKRGALDAMRAKDSMSAEEEEAADATEAACDAEEEKDDEKDESKEARDRRSARDRRAGARDARKSARDKMARDAKDAAAKAAAGAKGMDAAAVAELVDAKVNERMAAIGPTLRREEAAKNALYGRLSPVIGAFDHAEMTLPAMAQYGLDKLGVTTKVSDPVTALDFLLVGRSQVAAADPRRSFAQDSSGATSVDAFFSALN